MVAGFGAGVVLGTGITSIKSMTLLGSGSLPRIGCLLYPTNLELLRFVDGSSDFGDSDQIVGSIPEMGLMPGMGEATNGSTYERRRAARSLCRDLSSSSGGVNHSSPS